VTSRWAGIGIVLVLVVAGCSDPSGNASFEDVNSEEQAVETAYDRPVAAAIVVKGQGTNDGWVFACDSSNRLQRNIRRGTTWGGWQVFDSACVSVPSVVKWYNSTTNTDGVAVYARYGDNKLWQLWWPDATNHSDTAYWTNLSDLTGFGTIAGDVVVVEALDQNEAVSIAARKASNNQLWTFDYLTSWSTHPVLRASGATIVTTNTVSARAAKPGVGPSAGYLTGRGLTSTNDTTQWLATRGPTLINSSYKQCSGCGAQDGNFGGEGTSVVWDNTGVNYGVRRTASGRLQNRDLVFGTQWLDYNSCVVNGSPRMSTHALSSQYDLGFVRGGNTTSTNDLVIFDYFPDNECHSVGGAMYSAPTPFEYPTSAYVRSAVYMSTSGRLFFYDSLSDSHEHVTGLTLP